MSNNIQKLMQLTLIAMIAVSCGKRTNPESNKSEFVQTVATVKVEQQKFNPRLEFTGTVFANKEANLGATLPGRVDRIHFREGQHVNKGALIVDLSDQMLTQAKIENEALEKDFDRLTRLKNKGSVSDIDYDHLKAKYEASNAKVKMIQEQSQVRAPFSGVLAERMMEEGEIYFINPGLEPGYSNRSGIVRLMQLDPVKIKFDINEKQMKDLQKGLSAEIKFDGMNDKVFHGKINNIKAMLSTMTHSAPGEIEISNPKHEIKPGMFANVTVILPEKDVTVVPIRSIYRMPGTSDDYVYAIAKDSTVKQLKIQRFESINDKVVVEGVPAGTEIILEGKNRAKHGDRVKIANK